MHRFPTTSEQRDNLIRLLEEALELANQLNDGTTKFHIEGALDEVRSQQFVPQL